MQLARIRPELQCSLLCQDVRLEANGNFFLIGVLDLIRVPQVPVTAVMLHVFNRWTAGYGQFLEQVRLLAPDQKTVLHQGETRFALRDPQRNATTITPFRHVEFAVPGPYWVEVSVDDVLSVRYPVHVVVVPPPEASQGQAPAKQPAPAQPEAPAAAPESAPAAAPQPAPTPPPAAP